MLSKLISYLSNRHLLTNFIVLGVLIGAVFSWQKTKKEEYPNFDLNFVLVRTYYAGATPSDVERLVTREIEKELKGIDGIYEIRSTSTTGLSSLRIEFEPGFADVDNSIMEIRNKAYSVKLPSDVRDMPNVRIFKISKKAVIDVGIYDEKKGLLDSRSRTRLQKFSHALENRLLNSVHISEVSLSAYLDQELQIELNPTLLRRYNISVSEVIAILKKQNMRRPLGSMENATDTKFTIQAELDSIPKLRKLVVRSGFDSPIIRLGQIAKIRLAHVKNKSITKVNGREGIFFRVYKRSASDILVSTDAVNRIVKAFNKNALKGISIKAVLLDDESRDVRNRLSLISLNGLIGFVLIMIMLFIFMDFKSGFWVAMGIPFTFALTMIAFPLMGYSINNITLAAIIIVMGIIVDDAIVVAENISRLKEEGMEEVDAVAKGTATVFLPIVASIVTTCAAFLPILFFSGRFGRMLVFIPPVVFVMLFASLFESTFILPAHLRLKIPHWILNILTLGLYFQFHKHKEAYPKQKKRHWFYKIEDVYGRLMVRVLRYRRAVLFLFLLVLVSALSLFRTNFKFVMFPREASGQFMIIARAPHGTGRIATAKVAQKVENIIRKDLGTTVVGFRSAISKSRRGGAVEQNRFNMRIELLPKNKRQKTYVQLKAGWMKKFDKIKGLAQIYIAASRWGQSSGSAIEVVVQENNDKSRKGAAKMIAASLKKVKGLYNVEIEAPIMNPEYRVDLKRDLMDRLGVNPIDVANVLRMVLEGTIVHEFAKGDEEVALRVKASDAIRKSPRKILNFPVRNKGQYLVPIRNVVSIRKLFAPNSIERQNSRRTFKIYADITPTSKRRKKIRMKKAGVKKGSSSTWKSKKGNKANYKKMGRDKRQKMKRAKSGLIAKSSVQLTPMEVADILQNKIFPEVVKKYPTVILGFGGEIKDTLESQGDLGIAIFFAIALIYIILALLFNSMIKPLIIIMTIPFGAAGIIFAFWAHGYTVFGIFGAIGALGLAGVVVNDSIVMIDKLESEFNPDLNEEETLNNIAKISKTRLRAVVLTTLTTVAGVMPTAYGLAGYDSMLAEMMLGLSWGLLFGTLITLFYIPCAYMIFKRHSKTEHIDMESTISAKGKSPRKIHDVHKQAIKSRGGSK